MVVTNHPRAPFQRTKRNCALTVLAFFLQYCILKPCRACVRAVTNFYEKSIEPKKESPKIVVHPPNKWRVFKKCAIHIIPMTATAILAALNMRTFFLGQLYQGSTTTAAQNFDNLALQIAAKLYVRISCYSSQRDFYLLRFEKELLIIASLSTVLMDVLRHELLYGTAGLPLGILTAKTQFVDAMYLISPEFRMNFWGLVRSRKWFLAPLILICTVLALLTGPSSALLMIPHSHDDWEAGGAKFYMAGTNESIWPTFLDQTYIGDPFCLSPNQTDLAEHLPSKVECNWWGSSAILEYFSSFLDFGFGYTQYMPAQGGVSRTIYLDLGSPPFVPNLTASLAVGVHIAPCLFSDLLIPIWEDAMTFASIAVRGSLKHWENLLYRTRAGSTVSINSLLPLVQTVCYVGYNTYFDNASINTVRLQCLLLRSLTEHLTRH